MGVVGRKDSDPTSSGPGSFFLPKHPRVIHQLSLADGATPKTGPLATREFSLVTEKIGGLSVKQLGIDQAWQSAVWLGC